MFSVGPKRRDITAELRSGVILDRQAVAPPSPLPVSVGPALFHPCSCSCPCSILCCAVLCCFPMLFTTGPFLPPYIHSTRSVICSPSFSTALISNFGRSCCFLLFSPRRDLSRHVLPGFPGTYLGDAQRWRGTLSLTFTYGATPVLCGSQRFPYWFVWAFTSITSHCAFSQRCGRSAGRRQGSIAGNGSGDKATRND